MREIDLIISLQKIRNAFLDYLNLFFTYFGSETFFLIVAITVFWCISKREGYKFMFVFFGGQLCTNILKICIKRPRPYLLGAESVSTKSTGYSFPSGHSQSIANISTQSYFFTKKNHAKHLKKVAIISTTITLLVMFSRMYLGQHFLLDVLAGALLGVISAIIFSSLFELLKESEEILMYVFLPTTLILSLILIALDSGESIIKVLSVYGATTLGYFLEKKNVNYDVKSDKFFKYILKLLLGGIIIFLLKDAIKFIYRNRELSNRIIMSLDFIRYFLIGIFASLFAPILFKKLKL